MVSNLESGLLINRVSRVVPEMALRKTAVMNFRNNGKLLFLLTGKQ